MNDKIKKIINNCFIVIIKTHSSLSNKQIITIIKQLLQNHYYKTINNYYKILNNCFKSIYNFYKAINNCCKIINNFHKATIIKLIL